MTKNSLFTFFVLLTFTSLFLSDTEAQTPRRTRYSPQQRANIRATPILERPSRPGHFYGNTVRRNAGVQPKKAAKPTAATAASDAAPGSRPHPLKLQGAKSVLSDDKNPATEAKPANTPAVPAQPTQQANQFSVLEPSGPFRNVGFSRPRKAATMPSSSMPNVVFGKLSR